ncbi:portal protein, partial [Candidatus Woesearchaeota archaeon]|nr:portal protein [Candidatus Woesearchaeota archaeon]
MAESNSNLFRRLTRLFRSGPVVKRKLVKPDDKYTSSAFEIFRKNQSKVYSNAMSAYGAYDRMARYSDFSEMEYTPEIGSALDIYAEEAVAADENGNVLHIHSDNTKIKQLLDDLFFDTLNVDFNLTSWVRNLCKYGDHFLFNDVSPEYGVINAYPMPISEVEREEGFDPNDPLAVRFRWVTQGNQVLENWQVSHMRLLGNDAFIPYGSSVLEPARRIWRQLILLEDAMLVYRIVRAPERRVFKIDVGNVPPEEIPAYMERAQSTLKRASITDQSSGRVDLRYNPLSVDEDYFIPVRGSESGTDIVTLAGGTVAGETNDVEYIQKKLFAALKIPKAYLGYDEGLGAKATLSQEDIRFSRTIARVQRTILAELNKIAIIHLYCHGFSDNDLLDFKLKLSNPSTIAQQQKLELFRSRFEAAGAALQTPGLVDKTWVQKNIIRLTEDEISKIKQGQKRDKMHELEIESTQITVAEGPSGEMDMELGGGPGAEIAQSIDLGGTPESLSENDSIQDESVPIRVQSSIDKVTSMIAEDIDSYESLS